jgi:UMF1 family MFS transporter
VGSSLIKRVDKKTFSWALYDWANSAYATTVMAGFFPLFFKQYWGVESSATESSFYLGLANSMASFVIVLLAPVLGAIADRGSVKKRFLLFFALMGMVMTAGLSLVAQGEWLFAVVLYILATIGFSGSIVFYDALILNVACRDELDFVSAFGYALGYIGGGILFSINILMYLYPSTFGFADGATAIKASFVMVAIWWMIFSIPVMLFVHEPKRKESSGAWQSVTGGIRQLMTTFREIRQLHVIFLFLLAYWLYIDGVDTIVRMAIDYGMALGFEANNLIIALLITQFVGFPAAIAFGYLGEKIGTKKGIYIAIIAYISICYGGYVMEDEGDFYLLAVSIGLIQGGIQSLSRSFYARIIPEDKSAEFFGFYNMLGKFAAVLGPAMMGWVALATGDTRTSILSVIILFLLGGFVLYFVDEDKGRRMAKELETL